MFHGSLIRVPLGARGWGWGSAESSTMARGPASRGARFCFCCGCAAPFFFFCFCCGCAASSLTQLLLAASEHPLQKDIQCPGRVFVFAAGARAHSLTRCLPPGAPAARKKARRAPAAKKKRAPHTQQKSTHNKKINTPTGFRANGTWHTVRDPQRT